MIMGCYGIGVSRTVAAAIEQNNDADGIMFPPPIAPFQVIVTPVGAKSPEIDEAAEKIYRELWAEGIDTLIDDRDERPGVKFKDADLMGIPVRITVGKKALAESKLELRNRRTKNVELVPISECVNQVKSIISDWN
jgi:prolyl-tRNA synthetase